MVYGNAIKNGENNPGSYKTNKRGANVLRNFQDHAGQDITDPWIEKTNGGSNSGVDGAEVIWADAAGLVQLSSTPIVRDAVGNAYLDFTVPADNIQGGNAVVAVKKGTPLFGLGISGSHLRMFSVRYLLPTSKVRFTTSPRRPWDGHQQCGKVLPMTRTVW